QLLRFRRIKQRCFFEQLQQVFFCTGRGANLTRSPKGFWRHPLLTIFKELFQSRNCVSVFAKPYVVFSYFFEHFVLCIYPTPAFGGKVESTVRLLQSIVLLGCCMATLHIG